MALAKDEDNARRQRRFKNMRKRRRGKGKKKPCKLLILRTPIQLIDLITINFIQSIMWQ